MVFSKKEQNFHLEKTEKMAYICIKKMLISLGCAQSSGRSTVNSTKRGLKKPVQFRIFFVKLFGTCEQKNLYLWGAISSITFYIVCVCTEKEGDVFPYKIK